MLNKLAAIANSLDEAGMHLEADAVTNILTRVANFWKHKEKGPIKDFEPDSPREEFDSNSMQPSFLDALSGDNTEIMGIHATLRQMGIDPSGLQDDVARQIYQAVMAGQTGLMNQFAKSNNKFKRLG